MARKARRPRATFVRTAVALTALSFVPDLTFGFNAGSAATLITLHTVAAALLREAVHHWLFSLVDGNFGESRRTKRPADTVPSCQHTVCLCVYS